MKSQMLLVAVMLAPAAHAANPDIQGKWVSEKCESFPNQDGTKTHFKRTFNNTKKAWAIDFSTYGDDKCSEAAKMVTVDIDGAYHFGKPSKEVEGATEAEFKFSHRKATPKSDGAAGWMNSKKMCGFADWKAGQSKDIHKAGCAELGAYPLQMCKGEFDVVKVDGDKLFFGSRPADSNLCSLEKRPKKLGDVAVAKQ